MITNFKYCLNIYKFYGIVGSLRLVRDLLLTRLIFSSSRLIRWPWYIRGRKGVDFGTSLTTGVGLRIDILGDIIDKKLKFGNSVQLNDYVHIGVHKSINIGDNVLIGSKVLITDHDHGNLCDLSLDPNTPQSMRELFSKGVLIHRNVWIGDSVSILKGVTIGENSVIGSNSVVVTDIPPNCVAVGVPARPIKTFCASPVDNSEF